MVKRFVVIGLFFLVLHSVASIRTAAQTTNPCQKTTTWWFTDALPPGWFPYSGYPGTFVYVIAAQTIACSPPPECPCNASPGGAGSGGAGPSGGSGGSAGPSNSTPGVGHPIFLTTGDTYIEQTDVAIPGLGGGLNLRRTWNSIWPANEIASSIGIFGPNWRSTYEESIFMGSDHYLKYSRSDGGYWSFAINEQGTLVPASPASASAVLSQTASYWLLAFQNGEQRQFNLTTGLLTAVVDRNGNATQMTYDSQNRLTTVSDPAGRHLYFNYPSGSSYLVSSVTSDVGITLSYSYDTQGRLTQVTEPDLTTISFTYNTQSQITVVTDSNGKTLESHTYDGSGRGLTASQANGVNAVTVSYP